MGYETDIDGRYKIGDGKTNWNNLPYHGLTDELLEKINNGGNSGETNLNLENGEGFNSIQQPKDTENWSTGNNQALKYINEKIGTADDGYTIAVDENGKVLVGAYGKNSTMMNGKSQTVGGKTHAEGSKTIAFENNSHAEGNDTFAGGKHSHAEGSKTAVTGNAGHAEGIETQALGNGSHAEGYKTKVIGEYGHTEGTGTTAGDYAHAEGQGTRADWVSHAEGLNTIASGSASHAEGGKTTASGDNAHSEGQNTLASGVASHAEGSETKANGDWSHAEGYGSSAEEYGHAEGVGTQAGWKAHAEGEYTRALGRVSHAEGQNTIAGEATSHAEGDGGIALGRSSHVEGYGNSNDVPSMNTLRDMSDEELVWFWEAQTEQNDEWGWDEGKIHIAKGSHSHAEGQGNLSIGYATHTEGQHNIATGSMAHAEGRKTQATGTVSHTEGFNTIADGDFSHAEGEGTIASSNHQHVQGRYNDVDESAAFIIGNGNGVKSDPKERSNAMIVDWNGNLKIAGDIQDMSGNSLLGSGSAGVGISDIYATADDTGGQTVVIINLTDGRTLSFGIPYGKDGKGIQFRGNRADLDIVEKHDGYIYFCIDDATLFFDYADADGILQRKQINAKDAENLLGYSISTILNLSDVEIPTSKAVLDALSQKTQVQIITWEEND